MNTLKKATLVASTILALALSSVVPASAETTVDPSLRELAEQAGLLIGSGSIKGAEWTTDGRPPNYLADPQFAQVLSEQFNSLSPENEMKWTFVQPQEGVFDFEGLDRLVAFAEEHDMAVKGHGLISSCCNPDYVVDITEPDDMRAALLSHFSAVMGRYDGKMDRWDVVTEAIETMGTTLQQNDFYRVLGPDYIAEAFRIARTVDPDARLFINENLVEFDAAKRQALYELVSDLVADGVPIDGVALQMHETFVGPEPGVITTMVESYHDLGLEVEVAELDVHTYDPLSQAEIYGDVVAESLAAGVKEISTWGFTDKHLYTWLPGAKPLMFDEEYKPKPAFYAVQEALRQFVQHDSAPGVAALSSTSGRGGLHDGTYEVNMSLKKGTPGSFYRLYENDVLIDAQRLGEAEGQAASTSFVNKPNGTYVYRAELINSEGVTSTKTIKVKVKDAAPGKPLIRIEGRGEDGSYTVTALLTRGTSATSYTFSLDGAVIAEGPLAAATAGQQSAVVSLSDLAPGKHWVSAVFTNEHGSTQSVEVPLHVR